MKYRRALVTGGAGFIGSHIVQALAQEEIETVIIDDLSTGSRNNINSNINFIEADILDEVKLEQALIGVDVVFHNAAKVTIRGSVDRFFEDAKTNVLGTLNLLRGIKRSNVKKLIYASSMAVYGDAKRLPITEIHALNPNSPYGIGKMAAEKYCLEFGKMNNIDVICLRYFNTFGIRQTFTPYVGVITIFINRFLEGKSMIIFGDGMQIRDFISVKDIARANILAMKGNFHNDIFNVGTGVGTSINNLVEIIMNLFNNRIQKEYAPKQNGEPSDSIADVSKIKNMMGFEAKDKLANELPKIVEWIKVRKQKNAQ